jgi:hypothetical protein
MIAKTNQPVQTQKKERNNNIFIGSLYMLAAGFPRRYTQNSSNVIITITTFPFVLLIINIRENSLMLSQKHPNGVP